MAQPTSDRTALSWQPVLVLVALGGALVWAYWAALVAMAGKWSSDPQYSHGFLVPAFSVALLWLRRPLLAGAVFRPSWWCVPLLAVGLGMRLPAERLNYAVEFFEGVSLLLTLAGLCLLLGGWPVLKWAWPAVGFLLFMFPLPFNVERALAIELRWIATVVSTYVLQTVGLPAVAEGNRILLTRPIGVEEACSGLSMLMTFVALSTAVVFTFELPALDKVLVLLSAIPIAVVANVVRITGTALLMEKWDPDLAYKFFHDWAGWLMMVIAFALLVLEVWLLRHLFVKVERSARPANKPVPLALR